jgi:NAD+ synthase (glutamine-hydrolysing)
MNPLQWARKPTILNGMKILLAQINPVVGDIDRNFLVMRDILLGAREKKVDLVVFPELAVTGYPPRDLLERRSFAVRSEDAVGRLARLCTRNLRAVAGFVAPSRKKAGLPLANAAALLAEGGVAAVYRKMLLPSYDVFDETRWFEPGDAPCVVDIDGLSVALTICEDIWSSALYGDRPRYGLDPVTQAVSRGARLVVNMSASPFTMRKRLIRRQVCSETALRHGVPVLYCNQVGGNDDLIFDGGSFAVDGRGQLAANAREFERDMLVVDVDPSGAVKGKSESFPAGDADVLWKALRLGLLDYVTKCAQAAVFVGLSGGVDSALVAALAADALGPARVTGVWMPSRFSSDRSRADAAALAATLGIRLLEIPIEPAVSAFTSMLAPAFGDMPEDVAEENIQARCRGLILMALSNKLGGMVLATGNKSELATGYCTLYGDMVGAIAPIGDLYKTQVYALARHANRDRETIPESVLVRAPTAELRPDQTDQDTLPPYEKLDRVLSLYLEEGLDVKAIAKSLGTELVLDVLAMLRRAEYKRKQAAIVLKVSDKAFGFGRRYPIAQGYTEIPDESSLIP